jgi:hypothetical protein
MPKTKQKNRRYRNAKISEYIFKKVVLGFAKRQTAGLTAKQTKISEPAVSAIYWRLREHLKRYPIFEFGQMIEAQLQSTEPNNIKVWHDKVHYGGASRDQEPLLSIELLTRAVMGNNFRYVERLKASNPKQLDKAKRLYAIRQPFRRYSVIEILKPGTPDELADHNIRPFSPTDYKLTSDLLINELKVDKDAAFFRYLWQLLLKHPL